MDRPQRFDPESQKNLNVLSFSYLTNVKLSQKLFFFSKFQVSNLPFFRSELGLFLVDPALVSASFVGLAGLVGVLIGFVFVYKGFNRKHILLFSAIGTALAFIGLGIRGVIQSDPSGKY